PILTIVSSDIRLTHRSLGVAAAPLSHYTLSLHDALPILLHTCVIMGMDHLCVRRIGDPVPVLDHRGSIDHIFIKNSMSGKSSQTDRKSTRLNSSHVSLSYAVLCLKNTKNAITRRTIKNNK